MEKIKGIVFDLDGTLVNSIEDIANVVNQILVDHDRPCHDLSKYRDMVGGGLKKLLISAAYPHSFSDQELEVAYSELVIQYKARPVVFSQLYDGIEPMLHSLSKYYPLAVLSNKENTITGEIVKTLLPQIPFTHVRGGVPGIPNKPNPQTLLKIVSDWGIAANSIILLGDSDVDIQTARNAGACPCGASWGFRGAEELKIHGAEYIFDSPFLFQQWVEGQLKNDN